MIDFVKELAACRVEGTQLPFFPEKVKGYTEEEIDLIAKNCNLDIHGQFREFLLQMGKCSGGLILGKYFPMFNPYWNTKDFELFQKNESEDQNYIMALNAVDPIEKKIFYLYSENESDYYYYLLTDNQDDYVWGYYEDNTLSLEKTSRTLLEHLKDIVLDQTKEYLNSKFYNKNDVDDYIVGRLL